MIEVLPPNPDIVADQEAERSTTSEYLQSLIDVGVIVADPEALRRSLDDIMREFDLSDSFLREKPSQALLLTGLAAQEITPSEVEQPTAQRRSLVARAILGDYPNRHNIGRDVAQEAAIDRSTNHELSDSVANILMGQTFEDIRSRMGLISEDVVSQINVHAINIMPEHYSTSLPSLLGLDADDRALYSLHETALKKRTDEFTASTGWFKGVFPPPAWMLPGFNQTKSRIFLPALVAEELIAYTANETEVPQSFLYTRHEFVHCFDSLLIEGAHHGIGLMLEERRAEYFSGDQNGYLDVKNALNFILTCEGADLSDMYPAGQRNSTTNFYLQLAKVVGLDNMLDLATAIPESYQVGYIHEGGFTSEYLEAGNGINEALLRIMARTKAKNGQEYVDEKISKYVDAFVEGAKSRGADLNYVPDGMAMFGPSVISVLAIKDFFKRYPDFKTDYDWQNIYGSYWDRDL